MDPSLGVPISNASLPKSSSSPSMYFGDLHSGLMSQLVDMISQNPRRSSSPTSPYQTLSSTDTNCAPTAPFLRRLCLSNGQYHICPNLFSRHSSMHRASRNVPLESGGKTFALRHKTQSNTRPLTALVIVQHPRNMPFKFTRRLSIGETALEGHKVLKRLMRSVKSSVDLL
jgi:hypothetical protein